MKQLLYISLLLVLLSCSLISIHNETCNEGKYTMNVDITVNDNIEKAVILCKDNWNVINYNSNPYKNILEK